ncbi:uracil-DNA glycosylase family protein [Roseomonas elaeocarpi]|uniref:Uracil-DNA glycosylase family protein n=1 Tax=Roseomonas elaeocarpi TaxID=907779 RepID=A0ABV6JTG1_9PROT
MPRPTAATPPRPEPAAPSDPARPPIQLPTQAHGPADTDTLETAAAAARRCTVCAPVLPLGPRPILQVGTGARLLITSQAPGTKAHLSGIPFEDASGERLRDWLELDRATFYDTSKVAILPTGLCYPGRLPRGGDCPPRPECAPIWHPRILPLLREVRCRLLVGAYAQRLVLGPGPGLAERVRDFRRYLPTHFPLPHPSWRTLRWAAANPWFEAEVLPALREVVRGVLR